VHRIRLLILATVWLGSGCASSQSLPLHDNADVHGAIVMGRLVSQEGCVFLQVADGSLYGIAWPADSTEWEPDAGIIRVLDDEAAIGDDVELGGAAYEIGQETVQDFEWVSRPRDECLGEAFVISGSVSTDISFPEP
jgi:hypothetical protein